MSNMHFTKPSASIRARGLTAAISVCLVAVGAAAWLAVGKNIAPTENTAELNSRQTVSRPSYIYTEPDDPSTEYNELAPSNPSASKAPERPFASSMPDSVATVTPAAGFFVLPITGEVIKDFSEKELQYSLTYNDWRMHKAIDIKGVTGDSVRAAGDGTVTAVYDDKRYGLTVEINHGNDITAVYSGFETVSVAVGDVVAINMQIGSLGKIPCESVETTHLHFSVKKGDTFISPMNIIGV